MYSLVRLALSIGIQEVIQLLVQMKEVNDGHHMRMVFVISDFDDEIGWGTRFLIKST